jgi:glutamate/tyrosine decarboxylase-like PLP-dependent enzyme
MTFEKRSLALLAEALDRLEIGFQDMPEYEPHVDLDQLRTVLLQVADRMRDNFPYQHPLYVGQMLKPPHPIARLAYTLSLWINPNNHALDGGRASSAMEQEAVAQIARMLGWQTHLGHLCGGGTMANLEALWVAGILKPTQTVVASTQAHYTHRRICGALRIPFQAIPCDGRARMDPAALETALKQGAVGTVVVTLGTTATGSVDPLPQVLELQARYDFRIHVDAAYGGYFILTSNIGAEARLTFDCINQADSIVVDPHKHGLQPYGCGCVLFKDPAVGALYKHDSPYTYFSSDELHLGEISLECSRPGASAVALWATQQLLPMTRDGEFSAGLMASRQAAMSLYARLKADPRCVVPFVPELDILVWAVRSAKASVSSTLARKVFAQAADRHLHLALVDLPAELFAQVERFAWDQPNITCLRTCLMKPEHAQWLDTIWDLIDQSTTAVVDG